MASMADNALPRVGEQNSCVNEQTIFCFSVLSLSYKDEKRNYRNDRPTLIRGER